MQKFFIKKYFFAFFLLFGIVLFSTANIVYGREEFKVLGKELLEIRTVKDVEEFIAETESVINENILGRMALIELYGYVQEILGKQEFNNFSYVKDEKGNLYYGTVTTLVPQNYEEYGKRVRRLQEAARKKGGKTLFVVPPCKVNEEVRETKGALPINDANNRQDEILWVMHQYGIPILDLREAIFTANLLPEERFFNTDHHWTIPAAFYATGALVEEIKNEFGEDLDPQGIYCDINSYYQYTYEDIMLGSLGNNAGVIYSGVDDFTMLWPKFETDFTWYNFDKDRKQTGDFVNAFFIKGAFEFASPYKANLNRLYIEQVVKEDQITNQLNPKGPKILVIRDSYFSPMATFLAPMCSEIEMVWGRETKEEDKIEKMIENGNYDYVIVEVYPYNIEEASFNFFKEEMQ